MTKSILYIIFSIIATVVNLSTQEITSVLFPHQYELILCILSGTITGLVVKYILDKKYIFNFKITSPKHNALTFFFYSLMGVVTTLIFWATEYAFDFWFETKTMRYIGAIIGLSIGYVTKYYLDKKIVFIER